MCGMNNFDISNQCQCWKDTFYSLTLYVYTSKCVLIFNVTCKKKMRTQLHTNCSCIMFYLNKENKVAYEPSFMKLMFPFLLLAPKGHYNDQIYV